MKLTSIIFLGLGMTAAIASGDANLRVNTSTRQLRNSNQLSGGSWVYYLLLNAVTGSPTLEECCSHQHPACVAPLGPLFRDKHHCSGSSSGSSSSSSSSGSNSYSDSDTINEDDGSESVSGNSNSDNSYSNGESNSNTGNGNGDNGNGDSTQEQYLANEYTNGGSGSASQVEGAKGLHVWAFLVAALVVGIVAAALMANKKRKKTQPNDHTLSGSVKKRMALFGGGMFHKDTAAAKSSLCENDYANEPTFR